MRMSVGDLKAKIAGLQDHESVLFSVPKTNCVARVKLEIWENGKMKTGCSRSRSFTDNLDFTLATEVWKDIEAVLEKHKVPANRGKGRPRKNDK